MARLEKHVRIANIAKKVIEECETTEKFSVDPKVKKIYQTRPVKVDDKTEPQDKTLAKPEKIETKDKHTPAKVPQHDSFASHKEGEGKAPEQEGSYTDLTNYIPADITRDKKSEIPKIKFDFDADEINGEGDKDLEDFFHGAHIVKLKEIMESPIIEQEYEEDGGDSGKYDDEKDLPSHDAFIDKPEWKKHFNKQDEAISTDADLRDAGRTPDWSKVDRKLQKLHPRDYDAGDEEKPEKKEEGTVNELSPELATRAGEKRSQQATVAGKAARKINKQDTDPVLQRQIGRYDPAAHLRQKAINAFQYAADKRHAAVKKEFIAPKKEYIAPKGTVVGAMDAAPSKYLFSKDQMPHKGEAADPSKKNELLSEPGYSIGK